jgi:hypothetical protein
MISNLCKSEKSVANLYNYFLATDKTDSMDFLSE